MTLFLKLAVPAILTNVMGYGTVVINGVFAGRMNDPEKLAVIGLTSVFCNMLGIALVTGINSAQETLTSQAYGAQNLYLCGVYLNRGFFILLAFYIPIAIVPCMFAEQILIGIGQDAEVSRLAQIQIRAFMPAVLFYGMYDLYKRWLACMRITLAPMLVMIVGTLAHVVLCCILMKVFDMGIIGLAYSSSLSNFAMMATVMIYSRFSGQINVALVPINRDAFRGYCEYLLISFPSTVMICAELWAS